MALPPEARRPRTKTRKKAPKRRYVVPKTFRPAVATERPKPAVKGPPSPQRTGRPVTKQPITRKRKAAPTSTDTTSSARRSPSQKRRDRAASNANIRAVRRRQPIFRDTAKSSLDAPVLKALEQTTRPVHAIAAAAREDVRDIKAGRFPIGHGSLTAAKKGFQLKDKSLFSDVLKEAGVKNKTIRGVAGFALDVGLDPSTYVTGGTGSIARKAAESAGLKAEKKALKVGLSASQAKRFGERASKQATKKAGSARGVTVKVAGQEIPGVRRATAKAGATAAKATKRVPGVHKTSRGVKHVAADVNPGIAPEGLAKDEYEAIRQATRTTRHSISRETYKARQRAGGLQKRIGKENYQKVLDAIEGGRIHELPEDLRQPARFLRDQFKYTRRLEKRAGIRGATRRNYVPHVRAEKLKEGKGMGVQSVGAKTIRPSSSRARTDQRTLAEIRRSEPGKYVEDPGVLYASRMQEGVSATRKATLNRRLVDMGRKVKPGRDLDLKPNEAIYEIKGSDIRKLDPKKDAKEIQDLVDGGWEARRKAEAARLTAEGKSKQEIARALQKIKVKKEQAVQHVVLNEQAVDRALKTTQPGGDRSATGKAIDKVQGGWKFLATQPNPGFHVRNLAGDMQNAYLVEHPAKLARNLGQSAGALKVLGKQEKALRTLSHHVDPGGKGIKVKGGERVSYEQLIQEAEQAGAIRSGFVSRELTDLMEDTGKVKTKTRLPAARRWLNNREDWIRLATYIGGRKRGLNPEEAVARASKQHFDYSDLTELERKVLRRVMPFYTFSARNIPLQMKSLVATPGKYAQYEKVREELAKAFGYDEDWEKNLTEYEQRAAPLPVKINGKEYTISLGPSGLPLTDLNEFPTTTNPAKQASEWIDRGMSLVSPAIKTPTELWANFSFFFRDQLERDEGPLVPAPSWVKYIPKGVRKDVGIVDDYVDKRTGQKLWAAPARIVYALGVLPGPVNFANRVATPSERAGNDTKSKTLGYLGVRARQVDPVSTQVTNLYDDRAKLQKEAAAMRQRGISAANPTPKYRANLDAQKKITSQIMRLKVKRGDKVVGGRKPSSSKGGVDWSAAASGGSTAPQVDWSKAP